MRIPKPAFTLIELLVVITIIIVLLALLVPALEKAVYQATLVQCSGNVKAMVNVGSLYAVGNKRFYPSAAPRDVPTLIGIEDPQAPQKDLRPILEKDSIPWQKLLVCPLAPQIDISFETNDTDTFVYSNYGIYFGWQFKNAVAMSKIGSRFTVADQPVGYRVLIADHFGDDRLLGGITQSAHPDRDNSMGRSMFKNQVPPNQAEQQIGPIGIGGDKQTSSRWGTGGSGIVRGLQDVNYGMDDGAVVRYEAVEIDDDRLHRIPSRAKLDQTPKLGFALKVPQ